MIHARLDGALCFIPKRNWGLSSVLGFETAISSQRGSKAPLTKYEERATVLSRARKNRNVKSTFGDITGVCGLR